MSVPIDNQTTIEWNDRFTRTFSYGALLVRVFVCERTLKMGAALPDVAMFI
jgi:hypothetical protein